MLHDDTTLNLAYNACDVFITPSLAENLSNAIMESLACGTPVVAFDIGGNGDMIQHKSNGYLARSHDSKDLAQGIEWILNLKPNDYASISYNAHKSVVHTFAQDLVSKQYIKTYTSLIGGGDNVELLYLYLPWEELKQVYLPTRLHYATRAHDTKISISPLALEVHCA